MSTANTGGGPQPLFRPLAQAPANVNVLRAALGRYAKAYDVPVARIQRWISFMILSGALERLRIAGHTLAFVIKGGVTLELRFKHLARATRDFDAIVITTSDDPLRLLDTALANAYGDFTFTRASEPRSIGPAQQLDIKLAYRGRSWSTVQLELTQAETQYVEHEPIDAVDLSLFHLVGPQTVPCLSLRYQIAQKLHAVTTPPDTQGRENPRFRDLADLLLLRDLATDVPAIRVACEEVFASRQRQAWPPQIVAPPSWINSYQTLAIELGLSITETQQAVTEVQRFVDQIASA